MMKSILSTLEIVKELLIKYPSLRNNDKRLVSNFWSIELKNEGFDLSKIPTTKFLKDFYITGVVTNPDTITRARRKVQENHPNLKGEVCTLRKELEKEVRNNINL